MYLATLGMSLQYQLSCTGKLTDISEAISCLQKALQLIPEHYSNRPRYLSGLGTSLQHRFSHTGELTDISEAVSCQRTAVELIPDSHPDRPMYLANLGMSLRYQFTCTGELTDISEAISFQQKALQLIPESHPDRPRYLSELGTSLQHRFGHTGELTDISEAVSFQQIAVELIPDSHPDRPKHLLNQAMSLVYQFSRTGEVTDISEAISFQQTALQLTPESHPDRPRYLAALGTSLRQRFSCTREFSDISEAISHMQKALQLIPESHSEWPLNLANLGMSLLSQFLLTRELTDISEAISSLQKAVQLIPEGHPVRPRCLADLGCSLGEQFLHTKQLTDIHMAISNLSLAANSNSGPPSVRLNAAKYWIKFSQDATQLLDAHRATIHLISRIAGLEQTIEKRHNNLIEISTLSRSAAAVAFDSGETSLALEWLEQGRCLVWSQLNDLRTPFDTLQRYDPEIANELMSVSQALEDAGSRPESSIPILEASMLQKSSLQDEMATHARLARRWDQLLAKVHNIPEFKDFLRPPTSSSLLKYLPNSGTVIVINVHQDRCDALALRSGTDPLHIALPEFSYKKADNLHKDLKIHLWATGFRMRESKPDDPRGIRRAGPAHSTFLQQTLATLWNFVVKPILNGLGYSVSILTHSPIHP